MYKPRQIAALSVASLSLLFVLGCGSTTTLTTNPPPPPPPPNTEPNSCTTAHTTSPAAPAPTPSYALAAFTGVVKAGQLPVVGASVQVYAAGTTGNGSPPLAALPTALTTDANGSFSAPAVFSCPFSDSVLYAVATGGHAGGGAANTGIALATVLGTCSSVSSGANFTVNEATTVATALSMSQFLSDRQQGSTGSLDETLGASPTNSSGIVLAAATAANLADIHTGAVPGTGFPATGVAPTGKIDSLANILDACVLSSGASSTACSKLYAATATGTGTPSNTFDAAINLVKQPGTNVAALYALSQASPAYQPTLTAAPADWTLAVNYGGAGMNGPSTVAIDSAGKVWVSNYFESASLFSNTGAPVFPNGITGDHLENSFGAAIDVNDAFWVANEESSDGANNGLGSVSVLNDAGGLTGHYTSGGINFPLAVAFDTSGVSWVVDYGDSRLTLLDATGNPLSGTQGYQSTSLVFPVAVATDAKCNGYVANQSFNTVTLVIADGSSFTDYVVGEGPSGVAIDAAGNVWSANYYGNSVGLISAAGKVLSGAGYTGGGLDHPQGIAVDGASNVWVANYRATALTELAGAAASTPGAVLSPSAGWATDSGLSEAFALAIDASGNIWVTSFATNTLTEFVGLAVPVQTPMLGPLRIP